MKYLTINTFNKIPLTKNSLVLCDIDDTLITTKTICLKHKTNTTKPNIKLVVPAYIDKNGFTNLLQRLEATDSKLYFITSRNESSIDFTTNQFKLLNIDINTYPILYCGTSHKSNIVKQFIHTNSYDSIIFIDDLMYNLRNMKKEFGDKVSCFLFTPFLI